MSDYAEPTPDRGEGEPAEASAPVTPDEFEDAYGEPLKRTLDLDTWQDAPDFQRMYERMSAEVAEAIEQEGRTRNFVREEVFPRLPAQIAAPESAGVYQAMPPQIEQKHRGVLLNGKIEACDGTVVTHDTLVLTVTQIGVCLTSYRGEQLTLSQRLFRRDLRSGAGYDPTEEALELLNRRSRREAVGEEDRRDTLSELARRGIMAYAERAVLLDRSETPWRLGHGQVVPYELITGAGSMELLEAALPLLQRFVCDLSLFVLDPTTIRDRLLLTIGDALRPLEYAIVETSATRLRKIVENGKYHPKHQKLARDFVEEVGPQVVTGVYRASAHCPAHVFFAHRDHVHDAALIALADSALQEYRGFPLLIDLAHHVVNAAFGADTFAEVIRSAYADAGQPFQYLGERETRTN
jgi:hypothetical protein